MPSPPCACTGSKRRACRITRYRSGFWNVSAASGKGRPAPICASTGFGKTICFMRSSKPTRCPYEWCGATVAEGRKMTLASRIWNLVRRYPALLVLALLMLETAPARAIESVRIPLDATAIDLTKAVERYGAQGGRLLVSTAPGSDGIVRRIEVRALEPGSHPNWIVFALTNDTD